MLTWIIYSVVGKILLYVWSIFPLPNKLENIKFIHKLHICDLCAGVWIYSGLAFFIHANLLQLLFEVSYIPIVEQIVTGIVTSYVVHLFSLGWRTKFEVVVI